MREKIIKNNNNDKLYEEEFTQQSLSTNPFRKLKRNNSVLERELENLNLLKRQNLHEIKNLIDNEFRRRQKSLKKEKLLNREIEKEEQLNIQKKIEKDKKVVEDRQRDYDNLEREKRELKRKEREYNEIIKKQIEEEKKEEERKKQLDIEDLKRKIQWQKDEEEFKMKMDFKYKIKQELKEKNQISIDKKNKERLKKIEYRRKINDKKYKYQSKLRDEVYQIYHLKNEEMIKEKKDKYIEKQKNIKHAQEYQKKEKERIIKEQHDKRDEYERRNADTKQRNENLHEEWKRRVIFQFKKIDKRVQLQREYSAKALERKKFENFIKEDYFNNQLKEIENQTKYKNYLKLKNMQKKTLRINEMKKQKSQLIEKTKKIKDDMRIKKIEMRKSAERILENGKYKNIEEIYNKVFSHEDITFLSNSSSTINSLYSPSYQTNKILFKNNKIKINNYRNLKNSSSCNSFFRNKKELGFSY